MIGLELRPCGKCLLFPSRSNDFSEDVAESYSNEKSDGDYPVVQDVFRISSFYGEGGGQIPDSVNNPDEGKTQNLSNYWPNQRNERYPGDQGAKGLPKESDKDDDRPQDVLVNVKIEAEEDKDCNGQPGEYRVSVIVEKRSEFLEGHVK